MEEHRQGVVKEREGSEADASWAGPPSPRHAGNRIEHKEKRIKERETSYQNIGNIDSRLTDRSSARMMFPIFTHHREEEEMMQ